MRRQAVDAYLYASAEWQQAERRLASAAATFERGGRESATSRGGADGNSPTTRPNAPPSARHCSPSLALLSHRCARTRANTYAPLTTAHAEALIAQAEQALASEPARSRTRDRAREQRDRRSAPRTGTRRAACERESEQAVLALAGTRSRKVAKSAGVGAARRWQRRGRSPPPRSRPSIEPAPSARASNDDLADRNDQIRSLQDQMSSLTSQLDGAARAERIRAGQRLIRDAGGRARPARQGRGHVHTQGSQKCCASGTTSSFRVLGLRVPVRFEQARP